MPRRRKARELPTCKAVKTEVWNSGVIGNMRTKREIVSFTCVLGEGHPGKKHVFSMLPDREHETSKIAKSIPEEAIEAASSGQKERRSARRKNRRARRKRG